MNCPKCNETMEKAAKTDVFVCRSCGHSESGMTKEKLIEKVNTLEREVQELKKKKEKEKETEDTWL